MKYPVRKNKTIRKTVAAVIMTVSLSLLITGIFDSHEVYAEERTGYWKYKESEVVGPDRNDDGVTTAGGHGHYTCHATCLYDYNSENHKGTCYGESVSLTIDVEEPPMTTLEPGQELKLKVSASFSASNPHDGVLGYGYKIYCSMGKNKYHNREIDFETADGIDMLGIDRTWEANDYYGNGGHFYVIGGDQTFRAVVPSGNDGDTLWIRHTFGRGVGYDSIETYYYYEWVDTTPTVAPTEETKGGLIGWVFETDPTDDEDDDDKKIDIVINSNASNNPGNQDGGSIPTGIINGWKKAKDTLGVAGGIAGAVSAIAIGLVTDKKKYRMVIYKEFGDTIQRGEEVIVYACIVERDEKGNEKINRDLSRKINIFSDDGTFNVYEQDALAGDYKAAYVSVCGDVPANREDGIVKFKFSGKGGTFTNNMKFKLQLEPAIIFYQENLALPAGYEEHEPLQFTLQGFNLKTVKINVSTSEGSSYEAELAPSDNIPGTYFAVITDVDKSRQEAGTVSQSTLYVTAEDENSSCTQGIKLLRVNEGINVALPALNCYRAPLESAVGKRVDELTKNDFVPATTTAKAILVLYNAEDHTIDQMPCLPTFEYIPIDPDPVVKQRVDQLGIEAKITKVEIGYSEMTFFCTKAYLEPPCRFRIKVKASYTYQGKVYNCEKEVLMRSQPVRTFQSSAEEAEAVKADKEIERKLNMMLHLISRNNWESDLPGEIMIARLLLDNYEWTYGYDALLTYEVLDNFYRFLDTQNRRYLIEQYKAHREADIERDDWAHSIEYRTRFLDSWLGIAVRIGLALGTNGWSEAAFLAMDVNRAVVQYNDATPKEYRTTWDQVKAGSVPVAIWGAFAIGGKIAAWGIPKLGVWASGKVVGSKYMPQTVKNWATKVKDFFTQGAENVKNCEPKNLKLRASNAENAMDAASAQGEAEAGALLKGIQGDLSKLDKLLEAAQKAGDKDGAILLKELKLAVDTYRVSGESALTEGPLKESIIKLCQNKSAIEQLIKETPGQANIYRQLITKYRNKFLYNPIKKDSCQYIADMLNCDPRRISIKSISGNGKKALDKGISFGHDLDVTFVYKNAKGEYIELPQAIAEDALYRTTCRHAGIEFKSFAEAKAAADKLQIHACQPTDAERLPEVQKLLEKYFRTDALKHESIGKFINAEAYKANTPYKAGMVHLQKTLPDQVKMQSLMNQFNEFIAGRGSLSAEANTFIEAVFNIKDGFRFFGKGCNIVKNKAIGATIVGGNTGLTPLFHTMDGIAKNVASGNVTVANGLKLINTMGGFENCANSCFSQLGAVNSILQNGAKAGISNAVPSVAGAIGVTFFGKNGQDSSIN